MINMHVPDPNSVDVFVFENPSLAPNYSRDEVDVRGLFIKTVNIVKKGTEAGRCSVDLVLIAADGSKFVAITTGRILNVITSMVQSIDGP
jgi:hypothetical protein